MAWFSRRRRLAAGRLVSCSIVAALLFGPRLRAQWEALGPFGGSASVVQVDPHAPKTVIAGTATGLLFRSRDLGETWNALQFPGQLRAVLHTLVIDPRVPGLYFAGISTDLPGSSGMLRSSDAGSSWEPVAAFRNLQVRAIAIFRGTSQIVVAGTDAGIFRSNDSGLTWDRITPEAQTRELQPVVSLAFDSRDSNTIYAGTPHLPWKTADGGITWRSIHTGMIDDSDVFSILVDRNRPQRVFASACSGLYRSFSGGLTWKKLAGADDASYRTYTIVQDPQYENVLFAGTTNGMIRSADGGTTFERIAPYATRSIAFDLSRLGRIFIATDEAGILRTEDNGNTWQPVNRGFCNRHLSALAAGGDGAVYVSTLYGSDSSGLFRLENGSDDWSQAGDSGVLGEPLLGLAAEAASPEALYPASPVSLIASGDSGESWVRLSSPEAGRACSDRFAPPRDSSRILAVAGSNFFVTRDSAITWMKRPLSGAADLPRAAGAGVSGVFISEDGETWISCARLPHGVEVHGVIALSGQRLLAATSAGLRISSDVGRSWQLVKGPLAGSTIQAICRHPTRAPLVFAASYGRVYSSPDRGRSWTKISPGAWPVGSVKQLLVVPGIPDRLFVLTQQQGVFALPLAIQTPPHTSGGQ